MPRCHLVILIGLRASGKTTVGRLLAERLNSTFTDLDDRTAARLQCASTAEALVRFGEPRFRAAEAEALAHELATEHGSSPSILSLGGGTPMHPESLARLLAAQQSGIARIIYLRAEAPTLIARLRASAAETSARPSLTGLGTLEEVPVLLAKRDPVYRDLADEVIAVDEGGGLSAAEVAARIQLP